MSTPTTTNQKENQKQTVNKKGSSILFRLIKGFLYGNVVGLFAGIALFLLASAVNAIATIPVSPATILALIWSTSVVTGVAKEYSSWLEEQ